MADKQKIEVAFFEMTKTGNEVLIRFIKPLFLASVSEFNSAFRPDIVFKDVNSATVDFTEVKSFDSFFVLVYRTIAEYCSEHSIQIKFNGLSSEAQNFINLFGKPAENSKDKHRNFFITYLEFVGESVSIIASDFKLLLEFLGDTVGKTFGLFIHPFSVRWKDFPRHFTQTGVNAVPIAVLIVFLIGVISGYQGARQLHRFGADIYLADLIGVSITRELAPLMTAIIVAGRSGSAFAAEIGTMKVSEEIDALNSMGFDYIRFLILPRILAVVAAMPFLTILADLAGVLGGLVMAITTLDITFTGYMIQLQTAIDYSDVFTGIGKSIVFGFLIATVGCFRGMQVKGGAESVGKFTTASVVSGILLIIIADALFTFIFQSIGI